jgi:ribosomal protein S18 acetylase RimI-like enzyme
VLEKECVMAAAFAPVRLAAERIGEAAAVMGRALGDDPLFVSVLPEAEPRVSGVSLMMQTTLRIGLAHGEVWTTPPPIRGVALWLPPTHTPVTAEERDAAGWREVMAAWGSQAVARYQAFAAHVGDVVTSLVLEPHWHLSWLSVDPDQQGRGIGSVLVRQMTTRADAERMTRDLCTLAQRNVPLYEHLGFHVTRETILPRSGLRLWMMARRPPVMP